MKALRRLLFGFLAVLLVVVVFYQTNKDFNRLAQGEDVPMSDSPERRPVSLTTEPVKNKEAGVTVTPIYHGLDTGKLYFGISYDSLDLKQEESESLKVEDGAVQFLVKAIDTNGTNFTGRTIRSVKGTFSTFQYVHVDNFHMNENTKQLTLLFYPILDKKGKEDPSEHPGFRVEVPVDKESLLP